MAKKDNKNKKASNQKKPMNTEQAIKESKYPVPPKIGGLD